MITPSFPRFFGRVATVILVTTTFARAAAPAGRYTYTAASTTVFDNKTKLTWQRAVAQTNIDWASAKSYCAGLNLGGTGWRLPTRNELVTLVDPSQPSTAIDPAAFPSTPAAGFWSATAVASTPGNAWILTFNTFVSSFSVPTVNGNNVRCVR